MKRLKIAVLISGRGSNMQALIDACESEDFPACIVKVVSNRPDIPGVARAREAGLSTTVIDHTSFDDREAFDDELDKCLRESGAELVCLAGFMRLLKPQFVSKWRNRLINIHPSLLPAFRGLDTHERVIEAGVRFTGCSVHFVRPEMDSGPIIIQAVVPVLSDDSPETLAERVLKMEHSIYPMAVRMIAESRVRVTGNKVEIQDAAAPGVGLMNPVLPEPEDYS
ncbi:MAG: phosphoribosylglycinamide formyltransferase [Sphingomonadales bacterium]